jgi:hypothetical protein
MVATVDILVEVRYPSNDDDPATVRRRIDVMGRVGKPWTVSVDYDEKTRRYEVVPDEFIDQIEDMLKGIPVWKRTPEASGDGMTKLDLKDLWQKDPDRQIKRLLTAGRLHQGTVRQGKFQTETNVYWGIPPKAPRALRVVGGDDE